MICVIDGCTTGVAQCLMIRFIQGVGKTRKKKNTGTKWFCKVCELHFGKGKMEIKAVSERQIIVEAKQGTFEKSLTEVKREVSDLKREFKEFVKERQEIETSESLKVEDKFEEMKVEICDIKKSYSGIVQGGGVSAAGVSNSIMNAPSRTIKVEVSEVMEREKRKNNLVIFGIEETNDEMATREKVSTIVKALGLDENKIKYFGRVGRLVSGARPRIVRVVCEDAETKRGFLKAANRLKTMEGFANVYISLDLTKVQQGQDKILRENLRDLKGLHKEAKINNGEIVVFEDSSRKVLFSLQQ